MNRRFTILLLSVLGMAAVIPTAWMGPAKNALANGQPLAVNRPSLIVVSLNIAMVADADAIARELSAVPAIHQADLLFLQEVVRENGTSIAEEVAKRLGREVVFASPEEKVAQTKGGIAILSRSPLDDVRTRKLKAEDLIFRSRHRIALAGTVRTAVGPIRAITTHLDTRINPGERLIQLEPALEEAKNFQGPSVIGGDFNTNDMQWVSNVVPVPFPGWQGSRVRVLMESRGFRTPFQQRRATFDHMGMQLDWIYTNTLKPVASGIVPIEFSDHHAVWAQFSL